MKKLFLIVLCIALTACILSGCRRTDDTEPTTESTSNDTTEMTAPSPQMTTPTAESTTPTTQVIPSTPATEQTEAPSTVPPSGGVNNGDGTNGDAQRSVRGRR